MRYTCMKKRKSLGANVEAGYHIILAHASTLDYLVAWNSFLIHLPASLPAISIY